MINFLDIIHRHNIYLQLHFGKGTLFPSTDIKLAILAPFNTASASPRSLGLALPTVLRQIRILPDVRALSHVFGTWFQTQIGTVANVRKTDHFINVDKHFPNLI
jgi:hypothetical protein